MLLALDHLIGSPPDPVTHRPLIDRLSSVSDASAEAPRFVERTDSITWTHLTAAYRLAWDIQQLRAELASLLRSLRVMATPQLSFRFFWDRWNGKRINRLEYELSALERLTTHHDLLPRSAKELPPVFEEALERIKKRVWDMTAEVFQQLDALNRRFQELVAARYADWLADDGEVRLTSQFLRRCVKPHWDPRNEKAVILIFDGMRYDIFDELLRPMLLERMEVLEDHPASSLLPSETEVSRWALSAGTEPASFWPRKAENLHLQEALLREFHLSEPVEAIAPEGAGTGETVRYRAGNLDVYIFEFCDRELHHIPVKTLPDGREVPSRPLAFLYQQQLKSLIDTEVMAIVRGLAPGTKVFLTADHGFGRIHRERVWLEASWLNEPEDCSYLHAALRQTLDELRVPGKVRQNVWEFPVAALRMPSAEEARNRQTRTHWRKQYASIIFPKTGFGLCRPSAPFKPDAFSHGGISLQEMLIPMVVLRVKAPSDGMLSMDAIIGPAEMVEGEEAEFRVRVSRTGDDLPPDELRIDLEAMVAPASGGPIDPDSTGEGHRIRELPGHVVYLADQSIERVFRFRIEKTDDASTAERRSGTARRILTVTASYQDGRKLHRKSRTHEFTIQLNAERVIRRVGNLGAILGLTPKSLRGA